MEDIAALKARVKKLATEKAYLQLVIDLMNRLSKAPGLENTVQAILSCVSESIGGTDCILYYRTNGAFYRASLFRPPEIIESVDDPLVRQVFERPEFIEFEHDFRDTKMMTEAFTNAWTWVFPLTVANELTGVIKIEALHISTREMRPFLPVFFDFAALVLKNEIVGHMRLRSAYEELSAMNQELVRARDELEERVHERTEELSELNKSLEERVAAEVVKSREKDHILIQQSRMAAMGEMVQNIAHQWRQPLNALSVLISNIHADVTDNVATQEMLAEDVAKARRLIGGMTATIDEFSDFFRLDREKVEFDVAASVRDALAIVDAALKHAKIELHTELEDGLLASGYPNQFAQAVLNIVVNAQEALAAREAAEGRRITVTLKKAAGRAEVAVTDDGGGIPPDVLPKIFDPYYTTKERGAGIGLYLVKTIVEQGMGGEVEAANAESGARFVLRIPLAAAKENKAALQGAAQAPAMALVAAR